MDQDAHPAGQGIHPGRDDTLAMVLPGDDERRHLERLLADVDHVVLGHLEGRDVDLPAVYLEVAVCDELTGVTACASETSTVDHVVETALEQLQQVVTGLAGTAAGLGVVVVELLLEDAVGEAGLLLLLQLGAVLALLDARATMLAGRIGTTLVSLIAADEVHAEAARLLRHGAGVAGHISSVSLFAAGSGRVRRGDAWAADIRCGVWA